MSSLIRYKIVNKSLGSIRAQVNTTVASFDYPCDSESICSPIYVNLSPGRFKIEVWGAQGGSDGQNKGGKGGYSSGVLSIMQPTSFYLYIGGTHTFVSGGKVQAGGYNGGGNGSGNHTIEKGCGGGGGTDLRLRANDYSSRIIVAGGGGGCGNPSYQPGVGGGIEGGNGTVSAAPSYECVNEGGKQSSRGRTTKTENLIDYEYREYEIHYVYSGFGYGASWIYTDGTSWPSGGGGGGWFGGGLGCVFSGSGGGGSGYVFSSSSYKPPSMKIPTKFYFTEQIIQSGSSLNGNEGNGHARFTIIDEFPEYQCPKTYKTCHHTFSNLLLIALFTLMS